MMDRRKALLVAVTLPAAVYLGGCTTTAKVVSDIDTLASGVSAVLPIIQSIRGVSASVVAQVQSAVDAVKAGAQDLEAKTAAGLSTVGSKISAGLSTIQTVLSHLPANLGVPSWASIIITAAQTALPFILQAAGLAMPRLGRNDPSAYRQAMAILRDAAANG